MVLGHVGDIGDAVKAAIPFERVSTTTYPNRRGIPFILMEEGMARCKKAVLELAHPNAAGIDIGSASHFVAVPADRDDEAVREFKSFTEDLNALADWLRCGDVDTVAMESAGVYWILLFELLESRGFTVYLVNARHVKNVSGRKSDVLDCQWLQPLMSYGLLSGAFRPKDEICALRTVSRQRDMLLAYQARPVQPMQKALAQMNVQWANVSSDIVGETGQKIVRAIIATAEKVKSVDPGVLIPALHQLKDFQGLTGEFSWDDKGERIGSPFVAFNVNADGSYKIVYPQSAVK